MKNPQRKLISAAIALAFAAGSAHAVLERVGPINSAPTVGGFPAWYQDSTGLTLEFCDPKDVLEVAGGWCVVTTPEVPVLPEVYPTRFFDEHFYTRAGATMTTAGGSVAVLDLGIEAVAQNVPAAGGNITFSRIRVKLTAVPVSGIYRFIHPYGEESLEGVAGERIFFTNDVGIGADGDFSGALTSRLGPFLLPSASPGGAELPAVAGPGVGNLRKYIADPARLGPATGSTLPYFTDSTGALRNHNIFRIEGPFGSNLGGQGIDYIETTNFSLAGRLFTAAIPGRVDVDRASYARDASGNKLDVYARAFQTTSGRMPAQPKPAAIAPQLSFFPASCAGTVDAFGTVHPPFSAPAGASETVLSADGQLRWGQAQFEVLPTNVCVQDITATDALGNRVPTFVMAPVTDQVTVTTADYDPAAQTLTLAASSSDVTVPPVLSAVYGTYRGDLANNQLVIQGVTVPPANVRVLSSAQGSTQYAVTTRIGAAALNPVAADDAFTFDEDAPQILSLLANDTDVAGGTMTLMTVPTLGTAVLNPDGSVSYTPRLNANGTDSFTYKVTVGTKITNIATVTLNINPVNDAPTAFNDSLTTAVNAVNVPVTINLLANDTDPDGAADVVAAVNVTPLATNPPGASFTVAGGFATFSAPSTGTYRFTYNAQDASGATSANAATVTVTIPAPPPAETIGVTLSQYVTSKSNLQVQGTVSPIVSEALTFAFVNAAGTVLGNAGTANSDNAGKWQVNSTIALPAGTTAVRITTGKGTVRTQALIIK
jgi:hypothetical protein